MKKINLLLVFICIVMLHTSCSTYLSYDVKEGYSDYLNSTKALSVNNSQKGSIELTILTTENCGCYLEKANERKEISETVPYQCIGFPLTTNEPANEIKNKIKADGAKAYQNIVFISFADIIKESMERHLKAYFNQVNINTELFNPSENPEHYSSMSYYCKQAKTGDQIMLVKLFAKSNDGKVIEGSGQAVNKLGNGHLAWMIPLGVVTFPIGFVIGSIIFDNNYKALINKTLAEAIDIASAELSKKLNAELAMGNNNQYEIYVLLE